MGESTAPRGLIIDLITPVLPEGGIDRSGIERLLDRVIPFVQGILLCGSDLGRGPELNATQRQDVLETVLARVAGRVPLMFWITRKTSEETFELLESIEARVSEHSYAGEVFWVDTPLAYHSNRGLPQHYKKIASLTRRPLILFNDPEFVKQAGRPLKRSNIRTAILKEIAQLEELKGLIFRGTLERARNYQKAVRTRDDLRMFDGDERRFLSHPSRHGVVSAGANLAPGAWQKVTASSIGATGDSKTYPDHLKQIWAWGSYLEALRGLYEESPGQRILAALAKKGVFDEAVLGKTGHFDLDAATEILGLMKNKGDF